MRKQLMTALRGAVAYLDWFLDAIPSFEDGRFYRHGEWGCKLHLSRFWIGPEDRESPPAASTRDDT